MAVGLYQLLAGLLFALLVALASHRLRFLSTGGAAAQAVLGFVFLGLGGWGWTVPVLVFFLLSSFLSRRAGKVSGSERQLQAPLPRNSRQVAANGGIAATCVLLQLAWPHPAWYGAFLGALAAATADTWGTEIGMRSPHPPRRITNLEPAEPGTSGAVSVRGLAAGVAGAALIGVSSFPWVQGAGLPIVACTIAAGMSGSLADSLAGDLAQGRYRCDVCGRPVEDRVHCEKPAVRTGGLVLVDNDLVNLICTAIGGILGGILWPGG